MRKLGREISQATVFVGRLTAGLVVCRTSGSAEKTAKRDVRVERAVELCDVRAVLRPTHPVLSKFWPFRKEAKGGAEIGSKQC